MTTHSSDFLFCPPNNLSKKLSDNSCLTKNDIKKYQEAAIYLYLEHELINIRFSSA